MSATAPAPFSTRRKLRVWLVQRGVWDMERESMPLAVAYLKATVDADAGLRGECDTRIFNFGGGASALAMARKLFFEDSAPDIIAFSVLGWNYNVFGHLTEMFRQIKPDGWVVYGGTHVSNQAERVFRTHRDVDVVVNGEGEHTFLELLRAIASGRTRHELDDVLGISFKRPGGHVVTTPDRGRIEQLDSIPSPLLTGTITLRDPEGRLRYDVVLMETNRGCPYQCAFCYWGGAIGQKIRRFSTERMLAELELVARERVPEIALCDANFGLLPEDAEFVEHFIRLRERYGFPRTFETSWAKNKGEVFMSVVRRMRETGVKSSFTLALQTLHPPALKLMGRSNMKVNKWQDLTGWLAENELECYAELIWGAPGETSESFIEGYENLSHNVSRIAVYPLLVMPNTDYSEDRARHGLILLRSKNDDFEYVVVSNREVSFEQNQQMHKFIFWARVVAENQIFRWIWRPLRHLEGIGQTKVLTSLDRWFENRDDHCSVGLIACRSEMVDNLDASRVSRGLRYFYAQPELAARLQEWWDSEIMPGIQVDRKPFFRDLLRYDLETLPRYQQDEGDSDSVIIGGLGYDVRHVEFMFDIPFCVEQLRLHGSVEPQAERRIETLYYRHGFATHIDNSEFVGRYVGKTRVQIDEELRNTPAFAHVPRGIDLNGAEPINWKSHVVSTSSTGQNALSV